jgi:hypothetical protein
MNSEEIRQVADMVEQLEEAFPDAEIDQDWGYIKVESGDKSLWAEILITMSGPDIANVSMELHKANGLGITLRLDDIVEEGEPPQDALEAASIMVEAMRSQLADLQSVVGGLGVGNE